MRPDYPIGLPVRLKLVDYDELSGGGVLVAWGEHNGECAVAWEDGGECLIEDGVPADWVEHDLSQPLARSWAREEVARRVGLDPAAGVLFDRLWAGWSVRARKEGEVFLTEEPPFGGWRREVVGIDTPDEATALAACLRALPPVTP